jgi:hypothetical protein
MPESVRQSPSDRLLLISRSLSFFLFTDANEPTSYQQDGGAAAGGYDQGGYGGGDQGGYDQGGYAEGGEQGYDQGY